ncbi:17191_t:CDS:1 [Cetraspora pellucida]|uniref:17191_t:CDS:1 n=1 Tax=Cetraspora pellucida TaxID=1433469 RepID=A0A9N9A1C8_9GLOM|nr:17191_t:CDS:1 [Cetraspora pellucida]
MEAKDRHLKAFFDELVLSANLSQKKHESYPKIMSQLLLICYILCDICNKFIINVKHNLALYLDSTDTDNSTINALAELGIISMSQTVWHKKKEISESHMDTINNHLEKYHETSMVLNIDDYYNIYTNHVPKSSKMLTLTHMATILLNLINATLPIPINFNNISIHNPKLVNADSLKVDLENRFIELLEMPFNE